MAGGKGSADVCADHTVGSKGGTQVLRQMALYPLSHLVGSHDLTFLSDSDFGGQNP